MQKTLDIEKVSAREGTQDQVAVLARIFNEVEAESYPDDPPMPAEELEADLRSAPSSVEWDFWIGWLDGEPVGFGRLWRDRLDNVHLGWGRTLVRPQFRRNGFGTALIDPVLAAAKEDGRTLLFTSVADGSPYVGFAEHLGFEPSRQRGGEQPQLNFENRLDLSLLQLDVLQTWIDRAKERAAGYELIFWEGPTEADVLEDFSRLMNVMNTAPMAEGEEDWDFTSDKVAEYESRKSSHGFEFWTYAARDTSNGNLAGFTRVFPNPWRPEFVYQEDTGVDPIHRNKGLGRWLKAAMLLRVTDELRRAKTVITGNATSNRPMLSINSALGFRPYMTWQGWQRRL